MSARAQFGEADGNLLLDALPDAERERLLANMTRSQLRVRQILFRRMAAPKAVHFPLSGVVSLVTTMRDGSTVEVATVGREGLVGITVILGNGWVANAEAMIQVPGETLRMDASVFLREHERSAALRQVVQRYMHGLFTLMGQNAACNRLHSMEERLARWLLMTHDRTGTEQFPMTHDFLSQLLGVRRASVTDAASDLQERGLIRYQRGRITVVDREGLEEASCECYEVIRSDFDRLYKE